MADRSVELELEERAEELGFEIVEIEWAGTSHRPVIRLRIDRLGGSGPAPGDGVTIDDCTRVSRALEAYLDESGAVPEKYVLEVSSPGVERPLIRPRDFERFAGQEIAVRGRVPLAGRAKRLEGELLGLSGEGPEERVRLRLAGGEEVEIPRSEINKANLVFRWGGKGQA